MHPYHLVLTLSAERKYDGWSFGSTSQKPYTSNDTILYYSPQPQPHIKYVEFFLTSIMRMRGGVRLGNNNACYHHEIWNNLMT